MIAFRDIHKSFGDKPVLSGMSLEIADREVMFIIGTSGVGKSVAIKILIGLLALDITDGGQIQTVTSVIDPDKLRHLGPLADLDPREAIAVEFLFPGERVRTAYVEVGDFAAGRAGPGRGNRGARAGDPPAARLGRPPVPTRRAPDGLAPRARGLRTASG